MNNQHLYIQPLIEASYMETAQAQLAFDETRAAFESLTKPHSEEGLDHFLDAFYKMMIAKLRLATSRTCDRLHECDALPAMSAESIMELQREYLAEELKRLGVDSLAPSLNSSGVDHVEMEELNPLHGVDFSVEVA